MAKVAMVLACLVIFLVFETSFGRGRKAASPCKTDNSCGANPVTKSLDGTDYCCSEGSRIKLKPPRGSQTEARCKCIAARAGAGAGGRKKGRGQGRSRPMRCNMQNDCGEGSVSGTSNDRDICCPAGHVVNKVTIERRGVSRERCTCQMPPTDTPV